MAGRYLLDTNIVIAILNGEIDLGRGLEGSEACFNIVVLGELYYGAERSERVNDNLARIEEVEAAVTVLPCDRATARHYGRIKCQLKVKGKPIPENDIWIAATAQQHRLTVVTRDGHFAAIDGLVSEAW